MQLDFVLFLVPFAFAVRFHHSPEQLKRLFCNLNCVGGKINTVCQRDGRCGPEGACQAVPTPNRFRKFVLDWHNEKRNTVALGRDTRGGNGKASNMLALSWDLGLEFTAQCWINRCINTHDKCRQTPKFNDTPGQNLARYSGLNVLPDKRTLLFQMNSWYNEIVLGNASSIDSMITDKDMIHLYGHFTQAMWYNTSHVGCGHSFMPYSEDGQSYYYILCNYGPAGNILRHMVYKRGEPCSECEKYHKVKCNKRYKGLCGDDELNDFNAPDYPYHEMSKARKYCSIILLTGFSLLINLSNLYFMSNFAVQMWLIILMTMLSPVVSSPEKIQNVYCKLWCASTDRACQTNGTCMPVQNCQPLPLSLKLRKMILHRHNLLRSKIATGKERKNGNSRASNMFALSYDSELEFKAQCALNTCELDQDLCVATSKYTYPRNLAFSKVVNVDQMDVKSVDVPTFINEGMDEWEISMTRGNAKLIDNFTNVGVNPDDPKTHFYKFAQMIWGVATYVGCALSAKVENGFLIVYFACYYNTGAVENTPVYTRGPPCSDCEISYFEDISKCGWKYEGLCGEPGIDMTWKNTGSSLYKWENLVLIISCICVLHFSKIVEIIRVLY